MKREVRSLLFIALIGFIVIVVGNSNIGLVAQDQPAGDDDMQRAMGPDAQNDRLKIQDGLIMDWMDDFEDCEDWRAVATSPLGDTKIRKIPGRPNQINDEGEFEDIEIELTDENGITHGNDHVLGAKTYFKDRGFDRVEVYPPNEYIIRGTAKEIRVWVLGRRFRHTLHVKLRDYRGRIHTLQIGRLDFWGWREMSVIVPGWLPQDSSYALMDKNLHFVSFFVQSDRFEVPGTFYVYLDNFRVITDLSEFTGDPYIRDNW